MRKRKEIFLLAMEISLSNKIQISHLLHVRTVRVAVREVVTQELLLYKNIEYAGRASTAAHTYNYCVMFRTSTQPYEARQELIIIRRKTC